MEECEELNDLMKKMTKQTRQKVSRIRTSSKMNWKVLKSLEKECLEILDKEHQLPLRFVLHQMSSIVVVVVSVPVQVLCDSCS